MCYCCFDSHWPRRSTTGHSTYPGPGNHHHTFMAQPLSSSNSSTPSTSPAPSPRPVHRLLGPSQYDSFLGSPRFHRRKLLQGILLAHFPTHIWPMLVLVVYNTLNVVKTLSPFRANETYILKWFNNQ